MEQLDIVIVGGGPAGISAGIHAMKEGLHFVVLEKDDILYTIREVYPKGKPVFKHPEDYKPPDNLWFENCGKDEMIGRWEVIAGRLGSHLHRHETVLDIQGKIGDFIVKTDKTTYNCRFVILAIGIQGRPRKLGIPGEELENVHYRLKDPEEYKGKRCLVIGGGDTAAETAILLAKNGSDVVISYRREKFFRMKEENVSEIERLIKAKKVQVLFKSNVTRIGHKTAWVKLPDKEITLDIDHVFICIGSIPNKEWLARLGLELDNTFRPKVDKNMETNIKGMFAIGDLTQNMLISYAIDSGWRVIEIIKNKMRELHQ